MKDAHLKDELIYESVKAGELQIKPDGTIWRLASRRGIKGKIGSRTLWHTPRRAEHDIGQYLEVRVMMNGKRISTGAHRLVFRHFKTNIPPGLTVNHENGNKKDNRPENLTLASYAEQIRHARHVLGKMDQRGQKNNYSKLSEAAAREIKRRRNAGQSLKAIAMVFGTSIQQVSKIAKGRRWAFLG